MVEQKYLTEEERRCPWLIVELVMATIRTCGVALLDCGHILDAKNKNVNLVETEEGFIAICDECYK